MNNDQTLTYWGRINAKFSKAPFELKAFVIFSLIATVISLIIEIFYSKTIWFKVIPITGWQTYFPYSMSLFITLTQIFRSKHINKVGYSRFINIIYLVTYMLIHLIGTLSWDGNAHGNPYTIVSPWRPVWMFVLPTIWILVLLSPKIKRYYESFEVE